VTQDKSEESRPIGPSARVAVGTMFFLLGAVFGSWVSRIPAVQQNTGVTTGTLSIALVSGSLAGMAAMAATGRLAERFGARLVTRTGIVFLCLALPLPALAGSLPGLAAALVAFSAGFGVMEVGVNAEAVRVERLYGRSIMSSLHGLFSIGGMAGSAAGGLAAARGTGPLPHLAAAGAVFALLGIAAGAWLPPEVLAPREEQPKQRFAIRLPDAALIGLGLLALCALVAEGAMSDWSALYLVRVLGTGPGLAAFGFSVFSLCMAGMRLMGDVAAHRLGAVRSVRLGGLLAAVGLGLALASSSPVMAIAGFGCVGLGMAVAVPLVYSAAGRVPGVAPSRALASVATMGSFGFLLGPPAIGFSAEAWGLRAALFLLVPLCLVIAAFAGRLEPAVG
jgi:MFS family permease